MAAGDVDMCIAQAADIFGAGSVAGAFVMGSFAVHPAAAMLAAFPHVLLRQELIRRLARYMAPFMFLPVVASIVAMTLRRNAANLRLDALGLALSLATIGITVAINALTAALRAGLQKRCRMTGRAMLI